METKEAYLAADLTADIETFASCTVDDFSILGPENEEDFYSRQDSVRAYTAAVRRKRADALVKRMLQHSRASSSQTELTHINAPCDEYLALSFHGLRAKEKSFMATFETEFGLAIPKLNVAP